MHAQACKYVFRANDPQNADITFAPCAVSDSGFSQPVQFALLCAP